MSRSVWLRLVVVIWVTANTVQAQDNSYISSTNGFWDESRLWSLAEPPSIDQSGIFITNDVSKTVTIDAITASSFPDTLTVSNLTVSAPLGATNTLTLSNTGSTAFHILNNLSVANQGVMLSTNSALLVDGTLIDDGVVVFGGGDSLILTNGAIDVGDSVDGTFIMSNGFLQTGQVLIGPSGGQASGTIEMVGGTMIVNGGVGIAAAPGFQGGMSVSDGGLVVATNGTTSIGNGSTDTRGSLTVSTAMFLGADMWVGEGYRGSGGLTINNGTVTLSGYLNIGNGDNPGYVSLNGGALTVTNNTVEVGNLGGPYPDGSLSISDGTLLADDVVVGGGISAGASLGISGGTAQVISGLQVGSRGAVSVSGGYLVVTNGVITLDGMPSVPSCSRNPLLGCSYPGFILLTGGQLAARTINIGRTGDPYEDGGLLIVTGGVATVTDGITLGVCGSNEIGYVWVNAGQLLVTNVSGTGFIDVQNGQVALSNGVLQVDKLVMTNSCGQFIHVGGTLIVGSFVFGPNAPRITSLVLQGSDLNISWILGPGQTNALQATTGAADGSYSTNGFTDIFVVTNTVNAGSVTNYIDIGATTNSPTRYYRVRWAP